MELRPCRSIRFCTKGERSIGNAQVYFQENAFGVYGRRTDYALCDRCKYSICQGEVFPELSDKNVPVGVQIVSNTYDDLNAFRVAYALSKTIAPLYKDGRFPDFRNVK